MWTVPYYHMIIVRTMLHSLCTSERILTKESHITEKITRR